MKPIINPVPILAMILLMLGHSVSELSAENADTQSKASERTGELLRVLGEDADLENRYAALKALEGTDDKRMIPVLKSILDEENSVWILCQAVKVLARMKDQRRINLLLEVVQQNRAADSSKLAVDALAGIKDKRVIPTLAEALIKARVIPDTIVAPEAAYRETLINALGRLGGEQALTALIKGLRRETVARNRLLILKTLGEIGDKRALPVIVSLLDNKTIEVEFIAPTPSGTPERPLRRGFPYNTRVGECALWAACTIRDGKPPFPIERLVGTFREKDEEFKKWELEERRKFSSSPTTGIQ